jgi:glycosyltransferase involved in cell wall biosynthesis
MLLAQGHAVSVITSAYDMDSEGVLQSIDTGKWNNVNGVNVYYLEKNKQNYSTIKSLISGLDIDNIFVNGMYSIPFVIYPWLVWKNNLRGKVKFILSPRGMLQEGALRVRPLKKNIFLSLLKAGGLQKDICWHATDPQEQKDIRAVFGEHCKVIVAPNVPKPVIPEAIEIKKEPGMLKLVYLSLITEKKNLHLALQWLNQIETDVTYDIYGPVKDKEYWGKCMQLIAGMRSNVKVTYKGDVVPGNVQAVFSKYHALFLPTSGENFGHAIYECLSTGRPVIISTETPWKGLEDKKGGFDVALDNPAGFKAAIQKLQLLHSNDYRNWCCGAYSIAKNYLAKNDFVSSYAKLLNTK